jgi:hypothetical protein
LAERSERMRISRKNKFDDAVTIRFTKEESEGIRARAKVRNISLSDAIRGAVRQYICGFDPEEVATKAAKDMVRDTLRSGIEERV